MNRVREMHEHAVRLRDEGASIDAQNNAFDDCEDEFFRTEAFEDISDDEERDDLEHTLDYNDGLVRNGVRGVKMNLFYMCANHDPNSYDPSTRCGIYMSGKLWSRNGVEPEKTRTWYCGLERAEWEHIVQEQCLPEAGTCKNNKPFDSGCRFRPFKEVASMVLEVSDKSAPGTCTQYAIRASIPPGALIAEIQKVQRGWFNAGNQRARSCSTRTSR
jgi:hypothetical protein